MPIAIQDIVGVDVVVFTGLISGVLACISSLTAALLLYKANRKQSTLLKELQIDRLSFDEKMQRLNDDAAKELEKYKNELTLQQLDFEANLKRRGDFENRKMQNLFDVVERSQKTTLVTLHRFKSMLERSKSYTGPDFLTEFNSTIVAFNTFSDTLSSLENLVRPKDKIYLHKSLNALLEILLGMRFEQDRREADDFVARVIKYEAKLSAVQTVLSAKYRRMLQPRGVVGLNR